MSTQNSTNEFSQLNLRITECEKCPRLVAYRNQVAVEKRRAFRNAEYWGRPVPGFGDEGARVLVVGLAPGAHGSNRTGRMFTGDDSGKFLYSALFRAGFASQAEALQRKDGLALKNLYITAVGRCAPPENKPTSTELDNCEPFLISEISLLQNLEGVVALGQVAYLRMMALLNSMGKNLPKVPFSHGAFSQKESGLFWMLASYHPSRQNTQTGRLTSPMFDEIWRRVNSLLEQPAIQDPKVPRSAGDP